MRTRKILEISKSDLTSPAPKIGCDASFSNNVSKFEETSISNNQSFD